MKKYFIYISFICLSFSLIKADEGFWLPQLDSLKYTELKRMGLQLNREDIYNDIGQSGLSNAVISFNGACSGVVVSQEGLLLTNFHCCSDRIMEYIYKSKEEQNKDFFLAPSKDREIYIPNLYIKTLVYIKDITDGILGHDNKNDSQTIDIKIKEYIQNIKHENSSYEYVIKPILEGNKYILYAYQKFTDIRAVFIPPPSIGRFGGDSLNWEWPRYSSDFAIFRIYADSNNMAANYSTNNVPYIPSKFIPISSDGFSENDLAMVLGYPSSGNPFETSEFVSLMVEQSYPLRSHLYLMRINMMDAMIKNNPSMENSYESLINSLSNKKKMWDLMMSEMEIDGIEKVRVKEQTILQNIKSDSLRIETAKIQNQLNLTYHQMRIYSDAYDIYRDGLKNINILSICTQINSLLKQSNGSLEPIIPLKVLDDISLFYKNFDRSVDQGFFIDIMKLYRDVVVKDLQINSLVNNESNISNWAEWLYTNSFLSDSDSLISKLKNTPETILNDPVMLLMNEIEESYNNKVWSFLPRLSDESKNLKKEYLKNILETDSGTSLSINGDGNIRLSFGKIKGYWDKGKYINYQTYLDELITEYKKTSHWDTTITQIENINVGLEKNSFPICFITSSQTSSGNSGSPVVNKTGELIGLNFDRNKSGTISDLYYDESTFRNIVVDSRYILFIVKEIVDAKELADELTRK